VGRLVSSGIDGTFASFAQQSAAKSFSISLPKTGTKFVCVRQHEALVSKTCTPCRGGIPPLTIEQAELFHAQAPDWQLPEEAHRIERSFRFRNFRETVNTAANG
jgi:hypothetical protein